MYCFLREPERYGLVQLLWLIDVHNVEGLDCDRTALRRLRYQIQLLVVLSMLPIICILILIACIE